MRPCKLEGCETNVFCRGYCSKHYERWKKTGDPLGVLPKRWEGYVKPTCSVDGCDVVVTCLGLCRSHYYRLKRYGDAKKSKNVMVRKLGEGKEWHNSPAGYIVRYEPTNPNAGPNGQVYEHRHVMSQRLGRPLRKGENVHHRNGKKHDNRPENLEIWASGQPAGQRVQDVAMWAVKWLIEADLETALLFEPNLRYDLVKLGQKLKDQTYG